MKNQTYFILIFHYCFYNDFFLKIWAHGSALIICSRRGWARLKNYWPKIYLAQPGPARKYDATSRAWLCQIDNSRHGNTPLRSFALERDSPIIDNIGSSSQVSICLNDFMGLGLADLAL